MKNRVHTIASVVLVTGIFFGCHAIVDAMDRHDAAKAAERRAEEARHTVVAVSEPRDLTPANFPAPVMSCAAEEAVENTLPEAAPTYTDEELEALAIIIYQEAGGDACSDETRSMVGTVVLNRVESDLFPDTIQEVATQKRQYGRLYWTGLVWPERASNPGEAHAVERAYDCARAILEGERALPADVIWQAEFPQGTETVAHQDGLYFCR